MLEETMITTCIAKCQNLLCIRINFMSGSSFIFGSTNFVASAHWIYDIARTTVITLKVGIWILLWSNCLYLGHSWLNFLSS